MLIDVYIIDWHDDIFCDYALRYCVATTRREKKVWYIITPRVKYNIRLVFFLNPKTYVSPQAMRSLHGTVMAQIIAAAGGTSMSYHFTLCPELELTLLD